ncbi:hypothetical protein NPS46_13000 [Pseudomonas putida]|uniref:hypothetical protein n=1 Tax=Pseudomonas putida TaxID=303 RepID=UPI00236376CA|nr:hypothetical protein [Pseudomonas putida]MDD2053466.1 hypothetical protein [Pseudomonas putida]
MRIQALEASPNHSPAINTESGEFKITSADFRATCSNTGSTTEKRDTTPELLARTINNEKVATEVAQEVRKAYKEGLESSNKAYFSEEASPEWRDIAQIKSGRNKGLRAKDTYLNNIQALNILAGKLKKSITDSPPLKIDAGNCGELASAAAKKAIEHGAHVEKWHIPKYDHSFTVVGKPPERATTDFKVWTDCWIIDPWSNIVCKAPEYVDKLKKKMGQWASKGKFIVTGFYDDGRFNLRRPLNPEWIKAIASDEKLPLVVPSSDNKNPWAYTSASLSDLKRSVPQENQYPARPLQEQLRSENPRLKSRVY